MSGEWVGAMGMTEPSGRHRRAGHGHGGAPRRRHFILDGRKTFITNGPEADVLCVYAKLDGKITTFVVERGFAGFSAGPKIAKMGMRASTMCELILDG
jgi:isovaleryl-CoA dehydrogenase